METTLDDVLPTPRLVEVDRAEVAAPADRVWERVRHMDFGRLPLVRALFALRRAPSSLAGGSKEPWSLRLDALRSTEDRPGFQVLVERPGREVTVGAIGKVWEPDIPFVHVADAAAYAAFRDEGWAKVAWALRVLPRGEGGALVEVEVRVDATDEGSWERFTRYFTLIGPGSRFIRRALLASLTRELGTPASREESRALPGDDLLPGAIDQVTESIDIRAKPEAIWPWLIQMGRGRAGFYAVDVLDNGGAPSARELHPELQSLAVGDRIPTGEGSDDGFEVLRLDAPRALVLGGLFDPDAGRQLAFDAPRPARYWQVTWAFALEPLDETTTRLHARARADYDPDEGLHALWIRPVHAAMQSSQLAHLAERAEGRLARDGWRDVARGVAGAALMALSGLTPFLRGARSHWGLDAEEARRPRAGDELVPLPLWSWTHAVEIDAPASEVWPWVAQVGADRAGFYSYQFLENLAGCEVRNAEAVHPEWAYRVGDALRLHPKMPPLTVVEVAQGQRLVAWAAPDEEARARGEPWASASWLFEVEPFNEHRCRVVSRFRCAASADLATRLSMGPTLLEPVGFAMDRRMLLGIRERAERARHAAAR